MSILLLASAAPAVSNACSFGALNQNAWININFLVVLLVLTVAAFVYTLAVLLPTATREKLRGAAKVEATQGIIALVIVFILVAFAATTCQIGYGFAGSLTSTSFQNPMTFATQYVENLLFIKSTAIFAQMYSASALYLQYGNIVETIVQTLEGYVSNFVELQLGSNVVQVYYAYSGVLTGTYTAMLVASFGVLFVFALILPIISSLGMTVLAPLSLIMRSIPFGGPRLREAADAFLGIAIAFYFILPLTITMNSYIVNWMYMPCPTTQHAALAAQVSCNPYSSYLQQNPIASVPIDTLFSTSGTPNQYLSSSGNPLNIGLSLNFLSGAINGQGGILSVLGNSWKNFFALPSVIDNFGVEIALFMFQAIVLIALDIAITLGFAQGLSKGLGAVSGALGTSPFWGNM